MVFHDVEYGLDVRSTPRFDPSILNPTPTTPALLEAVAEIVIVPETFEPSIGLVIETVGGVVPEVSVVAVTDELCGLSFPDASKALTV